MDTLLHQDKLTGLDPESLEESRSGVDDTLTHASRADLEEAKRRYALLATHDAGTAETMDASKSARTLRRYLRRYRDAERTLGRGFSRCSYLGCGHEGIGRTSFPRKRKT